MSDKSKLETAVLAARLEELNHFKKMPVILGHDYLESLIDDRIKELKQGKPLGYLSSRAETLLAEFNYDAEYCHGYKYMTGGKSSENVAAVKELKDHGMLEFYRGLMTDEGEVAGSGWCRSKKGNEYVEEFQL